MEQSELSELFVQGTPAHIRKMYEGLAAEAKVRDFGLLEEDVVVLDTETTGLNFSKCELIEVAAARLQGREVVDRFDAFIKPSKPIPPEITALTGITNDDVADARPATEVIEQLIDFVGGAPVLAHNASFDRNFVEKVPGGEQVSDMWVDTLALSRIALPALKRHALAVMASAFGCADVSHRANDDVDALCGMWRIILCGLSHMPSGLLGMLSDMHPEVEWPYRPILGHLALEEPGATFSLSSARHDLTSLAATKPRPDARDLRNLFVPTAKEVSGEFEPDGIVGRMYEGFERRPEQVLMAEEVRSGIERSEMRAIEAGTGVGKSIAYLLPMAMFAHDTNVTVGVATKTNALTDQIIAHELPELAKQLPYDLSFTSLKGYDHYPCLRRLERATLADLPTPPSTARVSRNAADVAVLTAIAGIYTYACQVPDGDLDSLGIRWNVVPRSLVTTSSSECKRHRCPFYPDNCMLHGARRRAASADVVVTNHSLLLRNVEAEGRILPPIRHWVVDEAHGFESEARRQWACEVSAEGAKAAFEELGGTRTGTIRALMAQASGTEAGTLVTRLLTKASASVSRAQIASADFFDAVRGLITLSTSSGNYNGVTIWLGEQARQSREWGDVVRCGLDFSERLEECIRFLNEAILAADEAIQKSTVDLSDPVNKLTELRAGIDLLCDASDDAYVFSAELSRSSARVGTEKLVAERLDVGEQLATQWLPETMSVTFTSATCTVAGSFEHFDHAVGLDRMEVQEHRDTMLDSSYDFDEAMAVYLTDDLPAPNTPGHLPALEDALFDIHRAMDGSVLTLFTNRREMEQVYEGLAPRLAEIGLDLAYQERGTSARSLRERFVSEKSLSLLALRSFWEGFDAAGDTLRCVVITKMPFASPYDPLVCERGARDQRAWWRYSLPEAVISVKQAAGRLIRTSTDRGVLVLADSRLATKRYGTTFLRSMPNPHGRKIHVEHLAADIEAWRQAHEL